MSKRESILRYRLIVKKLRKHPASFADIADYLAFESDFQGYNLNISKRTFQRDIRDISSLYNIDIQYDLSRKVYFIEQDEDQDVSERIFEAFDIFNALNIYDRISDCIHFEKRKPQGTENLYGLLHAIKNRLRISFSHQKYWEDIVTERLVEPYALKEFRSRWYLLARDLKDNRVKSFALDRLSCLEITKSHYSSEVDFDVNEYYKNCFGIIGPNDQELQEVILSLNPLQAKYIKSLPLHESQQILEDNNNEVLIKLTLYITQDFFMELLSLGDNVRVVSPQNLINDLKSSYKSALELY